MWWQYVNITVVVLLAGVGVYVFVVLSGFAARFLGTGTRRAADDTYGNYVDSLHKQAQHDGQRPDDEIRSGKVSASRPEASSKAA